VTLQEFIDRTVEQSGQNAQKVEAVVEAQLSQVFQEVADEFTEKNRSLLRDTKTVTFANGTATLTSDVLTRRKFDSELYDPDDPTKIYSLVPEWADFIRVYDDRVGYYCIREESDIFVIEPGASYEDGDGIDDTRKLTIPCIPSIPASASSTISAPNEFLFMAMDRVVERLKA